MISMTITWPHMHIISHNADLQKQTHTHNDISNPHLHLQPQPHSNNKKQPIHRVCDHFLIFDAFYFLFGLGKYLHSPRAVL